MKIWTVVTCENADGPFSFPHPITSYSSITEQIAFHDLQSVQLCETKRKAIELAKTWNEAYKRNRAAESGGPFSEVKCDYTGGGIWVYSAKYKGVYLYGGLDNVLNAYTIPGEEIEEDHNCLYDDYLIEDFEYPSWEEIINSIRNNCDECTASQSENSVRYFNPDIKAPCNT